MGKDTQEKSNSESEQPKLMTRVGIEEEKFVRTSSVGRYTPTIQEIEDLLIQGTIGYNEARILLFIKSKTVNFRNSDIRFKRKDISDKLGIEKKRLGESIRSLVLNKYLIEKEDKDNFFFYALDPITFDGVIIFKSKKESLTRMNRGLKTVAFLEAHKPKKKKDGGNLSPAWGLKASEWVAKCLPEEVSSTCKYSSFSYLKYILLKYMYINSLSATRGQGIMDLVDGIRNPEYGIKQLVALIHKRPHRSRAITEELLRADREGTDAETKRPIYPNALMYLVTKWDVIKSLYGNFPDNSVDVTEHATTMRNELAALISEYPVELNAAPAQVIPFKGVS